jgi:hypothetical protein
MEVEKSAASRYAKRLLSYGLVAAHLVLDGAEAHIAMTAGNRTP